MKEYIPGIAQARFTMDGKVIWESSPDSEDGPPQAQGSLFQWKSDLEAWKNCETLTK